MNIFQKIIILCCLLGLGINHNSLNAQSISFTFADDTQKDYPVSSIRSITFTNDIMHLNKRDGTTESWPVSTIQKYKYDNVSTSTILPLLDMKDNIVLFPNPVYQDMNINYTLASKGQIDIEILNSNGQLLKRIEQQQMQPGSYTTSWDGKDAQGNILPTGIYFCRISTAGTVSTKKITIVK